MKKILRSICSKSKFMKREYDKLTWYKSRVLLIIDDDKFARKVYKKNCNKNLNLENPVTFDEKIWWLKLNNRNPLLKICSDKYRVREYISKCGYEENLVKLYGVYNDTSSIDFNKLPEKCILKLNHTSGTNVIFNKNIEKLDLKDLTKRLNFLLKQDYFVKSREWNYKDMETKIIIEELLETKSPYGLLDYKFMCFNGEPKLLFLDVGVANEDGSHAQEYYRNIYDMKFELLDVKETRENTPYIIEKPENFEKMIKMASDLSKPFPLVRVDLYNIDGKIYFGEMTFYHGGGCNNIAPEDFDRKMGSWIDLEYNNNYER
ncbi:Uncharacterised protein [uncultured Clostridium sp.]|nr:Uncharacterised protein [uncultured Clostridium sp.]SCJ09457.1 Uncharacterised protein [uncultured Clostridium sp.]